MSIARWDVALTEDNRHIWISEIYEDTLFCPECRDVMIPVRGKFRIHHYRHKGEGECSGESAIHYSKKYEIAEVLKELGSVQIEGEKDGYVADVLFDGKWFFEVVFSNPPSKEKFDAVRSELIIFNFKDEKIWNPDDNYQHWAWVHEDNFREIITNLGKQIISKETPSVCSICKEVKGHLSQIKIGGRCFECDFEKFIKWQEHKKGLDEKEKDFSDFKQKYLSAKGKI